MKEILWRGLAAVLSRPRVANWLLRRSLRSPYTHIASPDGKRIYMYRWWLFNPYDDKTRRTKYPWCPLSIRVHEIMTPDHDRHLHDHPWNARTIILRGGYLEERESGLVVCQTRGGTRALKFGEYHRIRQVAGPAGATTLFITGKYRGTWGFLVDGKKVPWREHLGVGE